MTKISNQYSLTNILTADLTNSRLGVNNVSPTVPLDVTGDAKIGGSLTVTGNLTAQQFIVSSSVTYLTESFASGSHKFGDSSDDNHNFTGSLIVSGSANPLKVGSNLLFVSSSGNVGIGTTSPFGSASEKTIHLSDAAGGFATIYVTNSTNTVKTILGMQSSNAVGLVGTQSNNPFLIVTNDTERIRILAGGSVGIGTTNPTGITSDAKLVVTNGSFVIDTENNGYGGLKIDTDSTGDYNVNFRQGRGGASGGIRFFTSGRPGGGGAFTGTGNERLTILGTGNVGIGTSSPADKLEVIGTTKLSSAAGNITGINIIPGSVTNTFQTIGESNSGTVRFFANIVTGWANWDNWASSYIDFKVQSYPSGTVDRTFTAMQIRPTGDIRMSILTGSGTRTVVADSNGQLSAPVSDESVKENIRPIGYGINDIMKMNPVWFEFKEEFKDYGTGRQNGNIAQELEAIIPEAVFLTPQTNRKGIEYGQLHAVYIKAIQELSAQNTSLINRIEALENK